MELVHEELQRIVQHCGIHTQVFLPLISFIPFRHSQEEKVEFRLFNLFENFFPLSVMISFYSRGIWQYLDVAGCASYKPQKCIVWLNLSLPDNLFRKQLE